MVEVLHVDYEKVKELIVKGSRVVRVMLDSTSNQSRLVVPVRAVSLQPRKGNSSGSEEDLAGL